MKRTHGQAEYTTQVTHDDQEGWTAVELHQTQGGSSQLAARVVFWDAEGQFALEMSIRELPVAIVEALIAEAKATIRTA